MNETKQAPLPGGTVLGWEAALAWLEFEIPYLLPCFQALAAQPQTAV